MVVMLIVWSMIVAWVWLIWRLLTGQSILPERRWSTAESHRGGRERFSSSSAISLVSFLISERLPAAIADMLARQRRRRSRWRSTRRRFPI